MKYICRQTKSSQLRDRLDHPVVDSDAHILENNFALAEFLKQVAGPDIVERFVGATRGLDSRGMFWAAPTGERTIDRATVMLPRLYAQRLEEAGIDFAITYSTAALRIQHLEEEDLRLAGARALNMMVADMFKDVQHRMTPAALIPMYTPDEAIAELDFCVKELGFKAIMVSNEIRRPIPGRGADVPRGLGTYITSLTIDSPYDYDPFWQKCVDYGVAPTAHSSSQGSGSRRSASNFAYKRIGDFAAAADHLARSLFVGGVSRRFPTLNIGFLEGGVGWACQLYNDLFEIWEKRNVKALKKYMDPEHLDVELMAEMFDEYGTDYLTSEKFREKTDLPFARLDEDRSKLDDFQACEIETMEDIRDLFIPNFYFGCEADDRMNAVAFDRSLHRFGVKLKAMFGSDIGHWDVLDMTRVLEEAYEPVADGLMGEEDFRDFTFTNPVMLHAGMNPDFFKGTVVEGAVDSLLAARA